MQEEVPEGEWHCPICTNGTGSMQCSPCDDSTQDSSSSRRTTKQCPHCGSKPSALACIDFWRARIILVWIKLQLMIMRFRFFDLRELTVIPAHLSHYPTHLFPHFAGNFVSSKSFSRHVRRCQQKHNQQQLLSKTRRAPHIKVDRLVQPASSIHISLCIRL